MNNIGDKEYGRLYSAESDLACERRRADLNIPGVELTKEIHKFFEWERIRIRSDEGARSIGRPKGNYDTFTVTEMSRLTDEEIDDLGNEIAKELCFLLDRIGICPDRILVIGLGNRDLTPDSIGPKTAEKINATMHRTARYHDNYTLPDFSEIAVTIPGITEKTGIETYESIAAICDRIEPDVILAIDSITSRSTSRLGTTIQISDTGIIPGSGTGAHRRALSEDTLGVPVIAIGVPTVINARILTDEEFCDGTIPKNSLFVSPKDIDTITDVASAIISTGINQAFGIM